MVAHLTRPAGAPVPIFHRPRVYTLSLSLSRLPLNLISHWILKNNIPSIICIAISPPATSLCRPTWRRENISPIPHPLQKNIAQKQFPPFPFRRIARILRVIGSNFCKMLQRRGKFLRSWLSVTTKQAFDDRDVLFSIGDWKSFATSIREPKGAYNVQKDALMFLNSSMHVLEMIVNTLCSSSEYRRRKTDEITGRCLNEGWTNYHTPLPPPPHSSPRLFQRWRPGHALTTQWNTRRRGSNIPVASMNRDAAFEK